MFRMTLLIAAALLLWQEAHASGAARGASGPLRTAYTHVAVSVEGQTARTVVDQVFVNDTPADVEATFTFPLPGDATVTGFADWRDGKRIEAGIAGREAAAEAYEKAVEAGRRVALGESEGDRFRMKLFAIPGQGSRRVTLSYVQTLDALGASRTFVFPAERDARPSVFDLSLDLRADSKDRALSRVAAENHADTRIAGAGASRRVFLNRTGRGLERDFVLRWQQPSEPLDLAARAGRRNPGEPAYVEARFAFDSDPLDGLRDPRDVVIVLDASLSMAGAPLQRARDLVRRTLKGLDDGDRVALLVARDDVEPWLPALQPAGSPAVASVSDALDTLRARGRTNLSRALDRAGALVAGSSDAVVLLVSDGQPTASEGADPFSLDVDAALFGQARVVVAQLVWPRRAAELVQLFPQATARYLPDGPAGDTVAEEIARLVTAPVIEELSITMEGPGLHGVEGALPGRLSRGESVRLLARADSTVVVRVEGLLHGTPVALETHVSVPEKPEPLGELLAVEWARQRVAGLEATLARADEATRESVGEEIRGLGLTYGIATRLTSFVTAPVADSLAPDRIKPGDPEIRVHAPRNARKVVAVLPWGELVPCVWDETEGLWLGRFLVPRGLADGLYRARVLVAGQSGWKPRGTLYFRVDSAPPAFELTVEDADGLPVDGLDAEGHETLRIVARPADHVFDDDGRPTASDDGDAIVRDRLDLKRIAVRIGDLELPLERVGEGERWEAFLPADLSPGKHIARLVAVDYALNSTETTLTLEVR